MAKPFDAILKQILDDYSPDLVAWLAARFGLPPGRPEPIAPDLSTVQPTADKVFRLASDAGLIHLELQSTWGGSLPDRIFLYNALLNDRYGVPVRSVAIMLRPDVEAWSLTWEFERRQVNGERFLSFRYELLRIWKLSAEEFMSGGLGLAPLGLLTNDAASRLPELVRRLAKRFRNEVPDETMRDRLLASSYILMGLRYDEFVIKSLFRGVQEMEESSTYRAILSKGVERGRAAGRVEGRIEGLRLSLVAFLEQQFGSIPQEQEAAIRELADKTRLNAAIRQLPTLGSPTDLKL